MSSSKLFVLVSVLLCIFFVKNSKELRCWECRSDADPKCADPFDNTTIAISDCQKKRLNQNGTAVCIKKNLTDHGITTYIRQCHYLQPNETVGKCPPQQASGGSVTIDFCEFCDRDGCNGANSLKNNVLWIALLSLILRNSIILFITF